MASKKQLKHLKGIWEGVSLEDRRIRLKPASKKRWKNKTSEERVEHSKMMLRARWNK